MADSNRADRISRLEAFRGLGAIAVIVTHCFVVVPWGGHGVQVALIELVCLVLNGHAALMVFFVISGYVLGLSLDKSAGRPDNLSRFYLRRVFRIYPAQVVAIAVIGIALSSFDHAVPPANASPIFRALFSTPLSPLGTLLNSLLLRVDMNGVTWTLALEVAVSIVFPLLYWASRHPARWVRAATLAGLIGISMTVGNHINEAGQAIITGLPSGHLRAVSAEFTYVPEILNNLALYGYVFYVGLVAEPVFQRFLPKIDGPAGARLMWFALFLAVTAGLYTRGFTPTSLLIEVCGATFVVFCGVLMRTPNRLIRALDHPFFRRLGAVSYSFYLYHFIIVYCIATAMFRFVDPTLVAAYPFPFVSALAVLAFVVTATIGTASYHLIEAPLISYSRHAPLRLSTAVTALPVGVALFILLPHWSTGGTTPGPVGSTPAVGRTRRATPASRLPVAVALPFHVTFGDAATRQWMPQGWYDAEVVGGASFAWSAGERSVLTIPLPKGGDIRAAFEAIPFTFPRSPQQVVEVSLNGTVIEAVPLRPGKHLYSVVLPASVLRESPDTLDFHYAYVRSPRDVLRRFFGLLPASPDDRLLAVAWFSLDFSKRKP